MWGWMGRMVTAAPSSLKHHNFYSLPASYHAYALPIDKMSKTSFWNELLFTAAGMRALIPNFFQVIEEP